MNNTTIQSQRFGVEIEMTGITRKSAATVIAKYFGTQAMFLGGGIYDIYGAEDNRGRTWQCMRDGSIRCINKFGNETDNDSYSCELVTPILNYEDLNTLKDIMKLLQSKGAVANFSTGIHVHVSAEEHTAESLETLLKLAVGRENLLYEALQIPSFRESRWCTKISKKFAEKASKATSLTELEKIWYSPANPKYDCIRSNHSHYNTTRYHGINLHSFFTGKGVEFRYFNGTTDADKIEAYVQLCLGISVYAINNAGKTIKTINTDGTNRQKMDQMYRFLQSFGMGIRDFENLHKQMTAVWAQ